jgi:catechol 2,3-dioxygenase-like lactoylglutathione lyase family enzyme
MKLQGFHHVAYRCNDAKETVNFYRDHLGMNFRMAFAEDHVPSTGEYNPYMHVFLDAGNDNVLAFFELPESPKMARDENTPIWVQHIAFKVDDRQTLLDGKTRLEVAGIDVLGPIDHGIFESIYFFDPNGHRLELAANKGTDGQLESLNQVAEEMLEEWSQTRRAPRQAAWLHENKSD